MTTLEERPPLRPVDAPAAAAEPVHAGPRPGADFFGDDVWSPEVLDGASELATQLIASQDRSELFDVMGRDEFEQEKKQAAKLRAAKRQLAQIKAQADIDEGMADVEADIKRRQADRALAEKLREAEHRDELLATEARSLMRRLSSPVSYLASQIRARKWSLGFSITPAVIAVLIGAVQVQDSLTRLWHLAASNPLSWLLYGMEPLATFPLVAILICQATDNGAGRVEETDELDVLGGGRRRTVSQRVRDALRRLSKLQFVAVEIGVLLAACAIQVGPHMLLGESLANTLPWLFVPAFVVVCLTLVPALNRTFVERIKDARTEAELGMPVGKLSESQARILRQMRIVERAKAAGAIGGVPTEHGLTSNNQIYRALVAGQGRASREDSVAVGQAYELLNGIRE